MAAVAGGFTFELPQRPRQPLRIKSTPRSFDLDRNFTLPPDKDLRPASPKQAHHSEPSTVTVIDRQAAREERARHIYNKYGLSVNTFEPPPSTAPETCLRVQQRPRLRVHITCHECGTFLAASRYCQSCGHRRCKDCPRTAPWGVQELVDRTKRALDAVDGTTQDVTPDLDTRQYTYSPPGHIPLRMPLEPQMPSELCLPDLLTPDTPGIQPALPIALRRRVRRRLEATAVMIRQ